MIKSNGAKQVVDFTAEQGNFAIAAMEENVGYLGFCFNQKHQDIVMQHLIDYMLSRMREEGNKFYNPSYAAFCAITDTDETTVVPKAKASTAVPKTGAVVPKSTGPAVAKAGATVPKAAGAAAKAGAVPKAAGAASSSSLADLLSQIEDADPVSTEA